MMKCLQLLTNKTANIKTPTSSNRRHPRPERQASEARSDLARRHRARRTQHPVGGVCTTQYTQTLDATEGRSIRTERSLPGVRTEVRRPLLTRSMMTSVHISNARSTLSPVLALVVGVSRLRAHAHGECKSADASVNWRARTPNETSVSRSVWRIVSVRVVCVSCRVSCVCGCRVCVVRNARRLCEQEFEFLCKVLALGGAHFPLRVVVD